jgi:hypothetical protein
MIDVLLGISMTGSKYLLEESYTLSLRSGHWKYIAPQEKDTPLWLRNKKIETGLAARAQLYDLNSDPAERNNVVDRYPKIVSRLQSELNKIKKGAAVVTVVK